MELVELIDRATEMGARHGCGIVDHIEDRIVGLKVRDLYEVPAAAILLTAHRDLEKLVSTIHQNNFKGALEDHWAYLAYAGLWLEPLRSDLDAYMESANEVVTGEVTVKLYKGSVTPVMRSSPYALYDRSLASFGESGRPVLPAREPGLHRALHAAEPARPSGSGCERAGRGFRQDKLMQRPTGRQNMSAIYELIGRIVVEFVRRRYRRELRTAAAISVGVAAVAAGAYAVTRDQATRA